MTASSRGETLMPKSTSFIGILLGAALMCAAPIAMAQTPAPQAAAPADDIKTEMGEIDGATFRIDMPAKWNKGLVVMNHGYSPEPRKPQPGPASARIKMFTDRGFAVVQSSYSKGGWAIEQAMTDNEKLRQYFVKKYGKTNSVIATGGAMGASVTTASVEMRPDVYDAGLVTCCSGLESRLENMNWNFEMLALFEYYFPGVQPPVVGPLNGYEYSIGNTSPTAKKIQAALDASPEKAEIFRRAWGRKKEDVAGTVAFHTYLIHEAQERSGGNPFSNETTIYNVDDDHAKVNSGVKRYAADPGKDAYLKKWYTATGNLKKPLMILSPIYDPIVPADTTEAYVAIARRAGNADKVAFQFFDHYGHGSVTTPEVASAFDELLVWMKGGAKPKSGHGVNQAEPPRAGGARPGPAPAAGGGGGE
jgi:pimeloyl-ACP methyl ester carboxylesterase